MDLNILTEGAIKIIEIEGKLDSASAQDAEDKVRDVLLPECRILLDMRSCSFVSSAGLRALLMVAKRIKTVGGAGVMCGVSLEIREVMEMTGFEDLFAMYDSMDDAIAALK